MGLKSHEERVLRHKNGKKKIIFGTKYMNIFYAYI